MSSPTAVFRLFEDHANRGSRRSLRFGVALAISMVLHGMVWLARQELEELPLPQPKPRNSMEVSLVAAPLPIPAKPSPPKVEAVQASPPKPSRVEPPAKPKLEPKLAPKPKPVPRPREVPASADIPPLPSESVAKQEPRESRSPESSLASSRVADEPVEAAGKPEPFTEARADAAYLNNPKPDYPAMARHRLMEGRVLLRVQVLADGHPGQVRLERTSGHEILDEAALDTVKRWRFVPAKRGDRAVESWVNVPIVFKLSR